jgi:hypothetical protein
MQCDEGFLGFGLMDKFFFFLSILLVLQQQMQ